MIPLISSVRSAFALLELLIITRVILDFLGASESALFTQWMHTATDPLLRPFVGIFDPVEIPNGFLLEFHGILALIVYAFIGYLVVAGLSVLAAHRSIRMSRKRENRNA